MFNPDKIRRLFEDRNISQAQFIKDTSISKSNLYVWLNNTSIPGADNLEIIADYFNVPIDYFFDRETNSLGISIGHQVKGNGNKISGDITLSECQKEIEHLNALLEEKERVISEKERTIQILMNAPNRTMSEVKLVLKDDVKNEIEYLKEKFEALLCCTQGNEPSIKSTRNLPDDCPIQLKNQYALSDLIEINIDELEACIARIETELRLLEKIIKKRI